MSAEQPPPIGPTVPASSTENQDQPKEQTMARFKLDDMMLDPAELNRALDAADRAAIGLNLARPSIMSGGQLVKVPMRELTGNQIQNVKAASLAAIAAELRAIRLTAAYLVDQAENNADRRADR